MGDSVFIQRLKALMLANEMVNKRGGINKMALAVALNLPYHRVNPWFVRNVRSPDSEDLIALARLFGVPESFLVGDEQPVSDGAVDELTEIVTRFPRLPEAARKAVGDLVRAYTPDPKS